MQAIGVLGGTFDPVHCGHLRLALEMCEQLFLSQVRLIPAANPPHRNSPHASASSRLQMLQAAVQGTPELCVDDRELQRAGRSFTVETLKSLRESFPGQPLCLILGMDAFCSLNMWHRWREIPELAHIGVAQRPGTAPPVVGEVAAMLSCRREDNPARLRERSAGHIFLREIPALEISATCIRARLAERRTIRFLVPDRVLEIIMNDRIYVNAD